MAGQNKMKKELTKNETEAMVIIVSYDFESLDAIENEQGLIASPESSIEILTKKGWSMKSAEGTVGSLINKDYIEHIDTCVFGQKLYEINLDNVCAFYKEVA